MNVEVLSVLHNRELLNEDVENKEIGVIPSDDRISLCNNETSLMKSNANKKILHIVPGFHEEGNGISVAAKMIAKGQGAEILEAKGVPYKKICEADEVWVHSMWTPQVWLACCKVLLAKKILVRMIHGNLDPVRLSYSKWKKRLAKPIEKYLLSRSNKIVATCREEQEWIFLYSSKVKQVEIINLLQFYNFENIKKLQGMEAGEINILYLGRMHPLKGVRYLEEAVRQIKNSLGNKCVDINLRIVSDAFGEEKEKG